MQSQISSVKPYCELTVQHPFFETSQSCVSTKVTLSHRFKSSPAIPEKVALSGTAGYLMNAGHFRGNYVSSGDLNRGRRTESRVLFGYFLHNAKSDNPFSLQRTSRFCKPRFSPPKQQLPTNKIKTFPKGASRFCKPRISAPKPKLRTNPIKSFAAPRLLPAASPLLFPPYGGVPAGTARSVCFFATCGGFFGGLAAFVTFLSESCPFRDGTLRVRFRRSAAALQGTGKPTPCILAASRLYSAVKPPNNC